MVKQFSGNGVAVKIEVIGVNSTPIDDVILKDMCDFTHLIITAQDPQVKSTLAGHFYNYKLALVGILKR